MKAVVATRYGPQEVLHLAEVEKPVPKDNEVQVRATTVTAADTRMRGFRVPASFWIPARLASGVTRPKNSILGVELAGEIGSAGRDARKFRSGDRGAGRRLCRIHLPARGWSDRTEAVQPEL